jgi:molybdenum cofactor sulfurtransferase
VVLDAAAFVPTNRLDLKRWKPDFVALSFYKMFGYPTGVGCLLARHAAMEKLRRPWFAGGAVRIASVQGDGFHRAEGPAGYEDGTLDYLNLPAVEIGLDRLASAGIDRVHERVLCLTGWLLESMQDLRHRTGRPLVRVHGPANLEARGGAVAFNLYDPEGIALDIARVEQLSGDARISLRTGCFCNPGAGETAYGLSPEQIRGYFEDPNGLTFGELRERVRAEYGIEVGAIRASLGIASNFADVYRLVAFLRGFLDRSADAVGTATSRQSEDGAAVALPKRAAHGARKRGRRPVHSPS